MILVRQTVPHWNTAVFSQFFHNFLGESSEFYSVEHSSQYPCRIFNRLFMSQLNIVLSEVFRMGALVNTAYCKRTSCSCGRLFKYKRYVFICQMSFKNSFFLFLFKIYSEINQIFYFFRAVISQCQEASSL